MDTHYFILNGDEEVKYKSVFYLDYLKIINMIHVLIYIIGFILTMTFLKLFGKKMGFNYDPPHYSDYNDYSDNAQAYLLFSLTWFVTAPMFLIAGTFQLLYKFSQWFLKYPNV